MANIIDQLVVSIGLDASELKDGLDRAGRSVNELFASLKASGMEADQAVRQLSSGTLLLGGASDEVTGSVLKFGTASQNTAVAAGKAFEGVRDKVNALRDAVLGIAGPIVAAFGAGKIIADFSQNGEALAVLSDRIGVSAEKIDSWAKANRDAGGSAEAFTGALENWVLETGRGADEFFRLGEHVKGMTDVQAQYFLRTMGLSQESAAVFVKFKDQADAAAESYRGVAMTQEQVERAREANILWRRFTDQVSSLGTHLITALLPIVTKVMNVINGALGFLNEHSRAVKLAMTGVAVVIGASFLPTVLSTGAAILSLVKGLYAAGGAAKVFSAALMANPLGLIVAGVTALVLALDDLGAFMEGGDSLFGRFLGWLGLSEKSINSLRASIEAVWDYVSDFDLGKFARDIGSGIRGMLAWILQAGDKVYEFFVDLPLRVGRSIEEGLTSFGQSAAQWGSALYDGLVSGLQKAWDWIGNMGDQLADVLARAVKAFLDPILSVLDTVKGFTSEVKNTVGGAVDKVAGFFGFGERADDMEEPEHSTAPRDVRPAAYESKPERGFWALFPKKAQGDEAPATDTSNGFNFSEDFADLVSAPQASQQQVAAQQIQQGAYRSEGIQNTMNVTVENHIQTTADPQAVSQAVGSSVGSALNKSNTMLVNAQTGVVQKG